MRTWRDYIADMSIDQKEYMLDVLLDVLLDDHDSLIMYTPPEKAEYPDEPDTEEGIRWSSSFGLLMKKYEEKAHRKLCEEFETLRSECVELKAREAAVTYPG